MIIRHQQQDRSSPVFCNRARTRQLFCDATKHDHLKKRGAVMFGGAPLHMHNFFIDTCVHALEEALCWRYPKSGVTQCRIE